MASLHRKPFTNIDGSGHASGKRGIAIAYLPVHPTSGRLGFRVHLPHTTTIIRGHPSLHAHWRGNFRWMVSPRELQDDPRCRHNRIRCRWWSSVGRSNARPPRTAASCVHRKPKEITPLDGFDYGDRNYFLGPANRRGNHEAGTRVCDSESQACDDLLVPWGFCPFFGIRSSTLAY